MAYYELKLTANTPYIQSTPGNIVLIDSLGAAQGVDVTPIYNGAEQARMKNRQAGFKYITAFEAMKFLSAVDTTIAVFLTTNEVSLGFANGAAVNVSGGVSVVNDAAHPIPVSIGAGTTVTVSADNVGISNDAAHPVPISPVAGSSINIGNLAANPVPVSPVAGSSFNVGNNDASAVPVRSQALATIVDKPTVNAGLAAVSVVNDATLKRLRIRNAHASAVVALGSATVTLANGAIQLQPGEVWLEEDAAGANWYAISDTANTTIQIQGLK